MERETAVVYGSGEFQKVIRKKDIVPILEHTGLISGCIGFEGTVVGIEHEILQIRCNLCQKPVMLDIKTLTSDPAYPRRA